MPQIDGQAPEAAPTQAVESAAAETPQVAEAPTVDSNNLPTDPDAIRDFLYNQGKLELPVEKAEPAAEPQVTQEVEEQPETGATPSKEADGPTETPTSEGKMPNRVSTAQFDEETQRAMRVMHAYNNGKKPGDPGYKPLKAFLEQEEPVSTSVKDAPAEPQASDVDLATAQVSQIKSAIAELKAKRAELVNDGADTDEIDSQLEAAGESLVDAKLEAKLAAHAAQQEQSQRTTQQQQSIATQRQTFRDKALERFPTAGDTASPLGARVAARIAELNNPAHPSHKSLLAADAPLTLTVAAATELAEEQAQAGGISFEQAFAALVAKPKAAAPAPAPSAEQTPRKILPAGGVNRTATPPPPKSGEDILNEVGNDPDKAFAALYSGHQKAYLE